MNPCSNSCFKVLGVSQFMAANTLEFDGSVETPSADMMCPKYFYLGSWEKAFAPFDKQ